MSDCVSLVTSGVSQGSHLRPLCYIWFVNEISLIFTFRHVRVLFYDILSSRVISSNLLSLISINALWHHTRASDFLRVDFHRTKYDVHELFNGAIRSFNEFAGLFVFYLSRNQFLKT
jgi:hypothetical protein